MLTDALALAAAGLRVFPVWKPLKALHKAGYICGCGRTCNSPCKHPMGNLAPKGCHDASADAARVRWFWKCAPDANIGVATGGGLAVIDVDPRHGGGDSLFELQRRHGNLPVTLMARTGGGGQHLYYRTGRDVANSAGSLGPGLDVRGAGGFVVAPPSLHVSGARYVWEDEFDPGAIAPLPDWLAGVRAASKPRAKTQIAVGATIREGGRNVRHNAPRRPPAARIHTRGADARPDARLQPVALRSAARGRGGGARRRQHRRARAAETGRRVMKDNIRKLDAIDDEEDIFADEGADEPIEVFDAGEDAVNAPPPRGWLLGNSFCRRFVSSLISEGSGGKTALRMAQYLSLATKRSLTGEHVFRRARVLLLSFEDGIDELRRRMLAARLHHGISAEELKGWLFYAALNRRSGKIMATDGRGRLVHGTLAGKIESIVSGRNIDLVGFDPFVKSHAVGENSNDQIDAVMQVLATWPTSTTSP